MEHKIIMPHSLTAENGAKALLSGEFHETVIIPCSACEENGYDELCEECTGAGEYALKVPVSWTTIKEIYRKVVDELGVEQ